MPITDTPRHCVTIQTVWTVANAEDAPLTVAALARLGPYLARYGETMNLRVRATGGASDYLRLLADLPPDLTMAYVTTELQRASARFLRESVGVAGFAWGDETTALSVSPDRADGVAREISSPDDRSASGVIAALFEGDAAGGGEVADKNETPAWLRDALSGGGKT